jgi:type III secretion protein L
MQEGLVATLTSLPQSPGRRIIRREEAQSWIDGYRFLDDARRQADSLSKDARRAYEDAKARGFAEGRSAGGAEAAGIVADTAAKVDQYLASIEMQVAELALSIVEQMLGRFDDVDAVMRAARQALASFRREKGLKIRVSPQLVEEAQQALAPGSGTDVLGPIITVEADPRLEPRQCTIVTEFAVVDASLDAQLEILRRTLVLAAQPAGGS